MNILIIDKPLGKPLTSVTVISMLLDVGPAFNQFTVLIIDRPLGKPLNSGTVYPRCWVWG